jgi:DNA polymerase-3 subunit alpha
MAAMLNSVYGNTGKIAGYIQYCRGRGIAVLPPDINRSRWKFTVDRDAEGKPAILFGLGAVKSVGENAVNAIRREREENGPFRDIFDFCRRVDTAECNKRMVESLIRAGAFDRMNANRPQMLLVYERAMDANQTLRKKNVEGQVSLFDMFGGENQPMYDTQITLPNVPDCSPQVKLQMEKEAAGVYMSGHPLDEYREILSRMPFTTAKLAAEEDGESEDLDGRFVDMGGILTEVKNKTTKKGDMMAFVTLEDMAGQIECLVFPRILEKYYPLLQEDAAVVISGKISVREEEAPKLLVERVTRMEEWDRTKETAPASGNGAEEKMTDAQLAAKAKRKLFIRLERKDMDRASAALALDPGAVPVYLHIPSEKITLLCPRDQWVNGSEMCVRRMKELFGAENVVLKAQ